MRYAIILMFCCQLAESVNSADIEVVHVVSFSHLDAGYKYPYVAEVLSEWYKVWIPASIELSERLRKEGGEAQHRWTMSPWVASFFLDCPGTAQWTAHDVRGKQSFPLQCPNASEIAAFTAAVRRGDLNFYASDFCTVYEYGDADLIGFLSDFAHTVAKKAGQRHVSYVASQRDEPGITRAAIPLLVEKGVTGLSVGVDELTNMPDVPGAFVWRDEASGAELLVAWHNYGYGGGHSGRKGKWPGPYDPAAGQYDVNQSGPDKCTAPGPPKGMRCNSTLVVPGLSHALALFVQDDNMGPPTLAQLYHYFARVRSMFPKAKILASTFEDFFDELAKVRHTLPVVTQEIGDTWVDDIPSDPFLAAEFRGILRARTQCVKKYPFACNGTDIGSPFYNFSRFLIKNMEHDWGWDTGYDDRWSNEELQEDVRNCSMNDVHSNSKCLSMTSWVDQRTWGTTFAIQALSHDHPLRGLIADETREIVPQRPQPQLSGFREIPVKRQADRVAVCDAMLEAGFDSAGAVNWLRSQQGTLFANQSHLLAEPVVHVSSPAQRLAWAKAYLNADPSSSKIGKENANEFFKAADPLGSGIGYRPLVERMWSNGSGHVLMQSRLPTHVVTDYGGAEEIWQEYFFKPEKGGCGINVAFTFLSKTPTRITESWWMRFHPPGSEVLDPQTMLVEKLGSLISPVDVVFNGSKTMHSVSRGVAYGCPFDNGKCFSVEAIDAPVVKIGAGAASLNGSALLEGLNPAPVPNDRDVDLSAGFAFMLQNNHWNTNAIEWYPYDALGSDLRFRFHVHIPLHQSITYV